MNYKKLIIDGYSEQYTTPYASYFKRQAQIAKRDNFVEFVDFFNGCKTVINDYKTEIQKQYQKRLHENDWALNAYYQALERGEIIDKEGEPIQNHIDYIENDKKFVEGRDYKNDRTEWLCLLDENGNISDNFFEQVCRFNYPELISIENGLLQAEQEITNPTPQPEEPKAKANKANTGKPQRAINAEKLKDYFNATFKGMGNNNINYFDWLVDHLLQERANKEFAQIALMCYESGKLNVRKPRTFAEFYAVFCECVGCEKKASYKPNKLKPIPENLKKLFNYLQ